jgi:hypothetical protein
VLHWISALQNVAIGPSRHSAATLQFVAFGVKRTSTATTSHQGQGPFCSPERTCSRSRFARGRGPLRGRWTSLFWVTVSLFSRPKFPVRSLRETRPKRPGIRRQLSNAGAAMAQVSQISLYFSLLAGNFGWRLVRTRLRRQPASAVSRGCKNSRDISGSYLFVSHDVFPVVRRPHLSG